MTVNINKSQINLREQLKKLERPTTDRLVVKGSDGVLIDKLTGELSIQAIDAVVSGTAVDVFVYDTRKDSDGGAWRKRTSHTSWYNETLNTSTRGSRREFPAVAVIVLISNYVIIYDGDDPDLPMWMKIPRNAGAATYWYGFGSAFPTATSIYAMNGIIAATHTDPNNSSGGVALIRFIHDNFYRYGINNGNGGTSTINISERESSTSFPDTPTGTLVDWKANDVAMTVLPNAPIDDATGLPVPTIAVATDGGVSVIRDDGTVVDLTYTSTNVISRFVDITSDGKIRYGSRSYSSTYNFHVFVYKNIPSTDTSAAPDTIYTYTTSGGGGGNGYYYLTTVRGQTSPLADCVDIGDGEFVISTGSYSNGGQYGIHKIVEYDSFNSSSVPEPLVAIATTSFNTGWLHGNCKGAFLSDTDATNVTGTELVTNGTFDSNVSGWTSGTSNTITWASGGYADVYRGGSTNVAYQEITTEIGKTYRISFDVISLPSNHAQMYVQSIGGGSLNVTIGYTTSAGTGFGGVFTADHTTTRITLYAYPSVTVRYDNVSVRVAELDRSVNGVYIDSSNSGDALQVFGTITKSAVATGAELVKYGGFGSGVNANALVQPYNTDMDWGTGDFHYMIWVYHRDVTSLYGIISRQGNGQSSGNRFQFQSDTDSQYDLYSGSNQTGMGAVRLNVWSHLAIVRSGSSCNFYQDGISVRSWTDSTNYTNAAANLRVGGLSLGASILDNSYGASGVDFALFRAGASAPSAEQIKKIYEDEKVLFQENAACTLYGTSDAVTALAYDDTTDLLHVGTSSGRSEFKGLRRVSNTVIPVTTAISASNGLVAEQ